MKTVTTIIRDTEYSFLKVIKKEDGESFFRKIEKGQTEYENFCLDFHMKNVDLVVGNQILE